MITTKASRRLTLYVDLDANAAIGCHATAALLRQCEDAGWHLDKWWDRRRPCPYESPHESAFVGITGADAVLIWRYRYPPEAHYAMGVVMGQKKPLQVLVPFFAEPPCSVMQRYVSRYNPDRPDENPLRDLLRIALLDATQRVATNATTTATTTATTDATTNAATNAASSQAWPQSAGLSVPPSRHEEEQTNAMDGT